MSAEVSFQVPLTQDVRAFKARIGFLRSTGRYMDFAHLHLRVECRGQRRVHRQASGAPHRAGSARISAAVASNCATSASLGFEPSPGT